KTHAVGTITTSPVTFTGGVSAAVTQFDPATQGTALISLSTPAGFSTPAQGSSLNALVITPQLRIDDGVVVGKNLQATGTLLLGQAAPTGGLAVTITSNSSQLKLATSPTAAGGSVIVVNVPEGAVSANSYIQALSVSRS